MSEITVKEGTLSLVAATPQYTAEIMFPPKGRLGVNSIQLVRTGGAASDVVVEFEVTGDDSFTPEVPYSDSVDTFAGAKTKQLFNAPAVPLAARGRYKLTAVADTDVDYRAFSQ